MLNTASQNQGTPAAQGTPFFPPPITKLEDTGLSLLWLQDLTLKIFYYQGYLSGFRAAEELALPFAGIVDQILESLKREKLIEVKSSQVGLGEGSYMYAITIAGMLRAREALDRSQYAGPAPVPIDVYNESIRRQSRGRVAITSRTMRQWENQRCKGVWEPGTESGNVHSICTLSGWASYKTVRFGEPSTRPYYGYCN